MNRPIEQPCRKKIQWGIECFMPSFISFKKCLITNRNSINCDENSLVVQSSLSHNDYATIFWIFCQNLIFFSNAMCKQTNYRTTYLLIESYCIMCHPIKTYDKTKGQGNICGTFQYKEMYSTRITDIYYYNNIYCFMKHTATLLHIFIVNFTAWQMMQYDPIHSKSGKPIPFKRAWIKNDKEMKP